MESNLTDLKKVVRVDAGGGGRVAPDNVKPWGKSSSPPQPGEKKITKGGDTLDDHLEGGDKKPDVLDTPDDSDEFKPSDGSEKTEQEKIADMKEKITGALQEAEKARGSGGGAPRWFDKKIFAPKTNWKKVLRDYITKSSKHAYDWGRPNKRALAAGYYAPKNTTLKSDLEAVIAIDTSGSMTQPVLTTFVSEIVGIVRSVKNAKLTILLWHDEVYRQFEIDSSKTDSGMIPSVINAANPQSGGTKLSCIDQYFKKNAIKTDKLNLLILTDGQVESNPILPRTQKRPIFLINSDSGTDEMLKGRGEIYFVDIGHK
jgi:predicted metal-dependent peptidase